MEMSGPAKHPFIPNSAQALSEASGTTSVTSTYSLARTGWTGVEKQNLNLMLALGEKQKTKPEFLELAEQSLHLAF